MTGWLVVHAKPNCENKVKFHLVDRAGRDVYLPISIERRETPGGTTRDIKRPFFPRYLFVHDDGQFDPVGVRYTYGVTDVLRLGPHQSFVRIPDHEISRLKAREVDGGIVTGDTAPVVLLRPGDAVDVLVDDSSWVGTVVRMKGEDRVVVLLRLFGTERPATIPRHRIVKRAAWLN